MSGKKASEVNQLLRSGSDIRAGSINLLNDGMSRIDKAAENRNSDVSSAKKNINIDPDMKNASKEFPDAAKEIVNNWKELKKSLSDLEAAANNIDKLKSEYDQIMSEYASTDKEAEKISADLKAKIRGQSRSDPWYCDEEYRRADKVAQKYRTLKERVTALNKKLSAEIQKYRVESTEAQACFNQANKIRTEAQTLEQKAKDAVKLRADAAKAKNSVLTDFESIDLNIANKFMKSEYSKLVSSIKAFSEKNDEAVVQSFNSITTEIRNFSANLSKLHADFIKKQTHTREILDCVCERTDNKVFSDPMDSFRKGEMRYMSLLDFLDEFCTGKYTDDIKVKIAQAEKLFKQEKFSEADKTISEINKLLDEASGYAASTHEKRVKTIDNALSIQNAMVKLNYDVDASEIINEDGSFGGYNIVCDAGDEQIVFENMNVDNDGKLTFGIDHKESTKGTCGSSWQEIRQALSEENVFVEDIKKNGRSIHSPNNARAAANSTETANATGLH